LLESSRETVLTVALVLSCFGLFLGVVHFTFPPGMSLKDLIRRGEDSPWQNVADAPRLDATGAGGAEERFARLSRVSRKVKDKPATGIAWQDSRAGIELGNRHSIQTHEASSATIAFDEKNSLVLGENSLIVLKSYEGDDQAGTRQASLVVFGGELSGRLEGGREEEGLQLEVQTPTGSARLASGPSKKESASFQVRVREDKSSTVSVYEGEAEVTAEGQTVRVEGGQAVEVGPEGPPHAPEPLPPAPATVEPGRDRTFSYRSQPPQVEFRWRPVPGADRYRLVIARGKGGEDVVYRSDLADTTLTHGNLKAGTYTWSVVSLRGDVEGLPGRQQRFALALDETAPPLAVTWPEGAVSQKTCRLSGRTEPGAKVFVGNVPARTAPSGEFEIDLELTRGANVIVVESVDEAGNSAYESRMIKALY